MEPQKCLVLRRVFNEEIQRAFKQNVEIFKEEVRKLGSCVGGKIRKLEDGLKALEEGRLQHAENRRLVDHWTAKFNLRINALETKLDENDRLVDHWTARLDRINGIHALVDDWTAKFNLRINLLETKLEENDRLVDHWAARFDSRMNALERPEPEELGTRERLDSVHHQSADDLRINVLETKLEENDRLVDHWTARFDSRINALERPEPEDLCTRERLESLYHQSADDLASKKDVEKALEHLEQLRVLVNVDHNLHDFHKSAQHLHVVCSQVNSILPNRKTSSLLKYLAEVTRNGGVQKAIDNKFGKAKICENLTSCFIISYPFNDDTFQRVANLAPIFDLAQLSNPEQEKMPKVKGVYTSSGLKNCTIKAKTNGYIAVHSLDFVINVFTAFEMCCHDSHAKDMTVSRVRVRNGIILTANVLPSPELSQILDGGSDSAPGSPECLSSVSTCTGGLSQNSSASELHSPHPEHSRQERSLGDGLSQSSSPSQLHSPHPKDSGISQSSSASQLHSPHPKDCRVTPQALNIYVSGPGWEAVFEAEREKAMKHID